MFRKTKFQINISSIFLSHYDKRRIINIYWSVLGLFLPALAGLIYIPLLLNELGLSKFGLLSLCWIFTGYFSIFDFGISRALTVKLASINNLNKVKEEPKYVWSGLLLLLGISSLLAFIMIFSASFIAYDVLDIQTNLRGEAAVALVVLAGSLPFVILTAALRGILEAHERFAAANAIRAITGVMLFAGPALLVKATSYLPYLVGVLIAIRAVGFLAHVAICWRQHTYLRKPQALDPVATRELIGFGGWMTVSNLVGPLLLYLGRFTLAALAPAAALAVFSIPYDLAINLLIIPAGIISVLTPRLSALWTTNKVDVRREYYAGHFLIAALIVPLTIISIAGTEPFLEWWLNDEFSTKATLVAQVLLIGIAINAFGHWSQASIQAMQRPDVTAKLHVVELVLYLPYMYWLTAEYHAYGAALAWTIRVSISTLTLHYLSQKIYSLKWKK